MESLNEAMQKAMKEDSLATYLKYMQRVSPVTLDLITASTEAEFDIAFDNWLVKGIDKLESAKKEHAKSSEDALSSFLAAALSTPELSVTREENSNGHVDLTITLNHNPNNWKKQGEAKLWDGPIYHIKGLHQLLNRYTGGRECRGFVISYVKQKDIKSLFEKLRNHLDTEKPVELEGLCKDHNIKWSFLSTHKHSSGELVEVCHVGCNMFVHE